MGRLERPGRPLRVGEPTTHQLAKFPDVTHAALLITDADVEKSLRFIFPRLSKRSLRSSYADGDAPPERSGGVNEIDHGRLSGRRHRTWVDTKCSAVRSGVAKPQGPKHRPEKQ
jgi:hypothetical protein